ncbi:reverse transcriptase domain-containing protein [Tanacetum coccineum]
MENQPKETNAPVIQQSNKEQTPSIPFPKRLRKEKEEAQQRKFLENLKQLRINLPFIEALAQMPKYAKFLRSLLTNKARLEKACTITMNERCSAILLNKLLSKEKDPGSFTIPCDIGQLHIDNALADLGASISLMPYTMYKKLGLGEPKPIRMSLELADKSIQYPRGIIEKVLIKVDKFILPIDFVILDMPEDFRVPIILGRPFLATTRAMIDVFNQKITLRVGDEESDSFLLKGLKESIDQSDLVLEERKGSIAWNMSDIKGISPSYCTYKIIMEDDFKPVIQPQRRLNSKVQEVVKYETVKLLNFGLIYPISDSPCVSPIHVVPKKRGMTIVLNDNNELIPSHTITGWRVCIDYCKLNDSTRKDHFPLPFIDQMLERLFRNEYDCFLDGFSGFFQILIAREDQDKTTFTCPYNTFAYRRMPFGLCNAPATFQRCMTAIFHDMVEDFMEVFMDDFSVFSNSFDCYLANLDRMLARCEETNLVAKPRLIRWVLLLQGFDIEIKDKKGAENLVVDHLSRLENSNLGTFTEEEISDEFIDELLMILKAELDNDEPGYVDYVNYIVGKIVPPNWMPEKQRRFFSQVKNYFWDEPYAFKLFPDNVIRRCIAGSKIFEILAHCHYGPTRGHHSASITGRKVYESRFYWPRIFKDAKDYVMKCDACQRSLCGDKNFKVGDKVLLFNSRLKMHPGKLKSRWYGPNAVKVVYPYGTVEITDKNEISFKVNGQRLKKYYDEHIDTGNDDEIRSKYGVFQFMDTS